jgi:glucan 1,3-beta-glucosidase
MASPKSYTEVGSAIFIDSTITNCPIGWQVQGRSNSSVSLSLFNVQTNNVPTIVKYDGGATLLAGGGSKLVAAWGLGKRYDTTNGEASGVWQDGQNFPRAPAIPSTLLSGGGYFARSKPQYESLPASSFINAKLAPYNAAGNGATDDTAALQAAVNAAASSGRVLWIPAGVYLITNTLTIPSGAKVVGQSWSQIIGAGANFANIQAPRAVIRVGNVGDVGSVELQDLLFSVRGATAGAIVLEWNIHESSPGSAAMWGKSTTKPSTT